MINLQTIKTKILDVLAKELVIHPLAQRRLLPSKEARLTDKLDLDAIGVVHAVEQTEHGKKKLYVIDGAHRIKALLNNDMGDWPTKVQVYLGVDNPTACALFLSLNDRSAVAAFDKYMAEVNSDNPAAVGSRKICKAHNLEVSRTKGTGKVSCVMALKRIFSLEKVNKGTTLSKTLDLSQAAWGEHPNAGGAAFEGVLLEGLARFIFAHQTELDWKSLIKKLAKFPGGPGNIIGDAKGAFYLKGSLVKRISDVIAVIYNKGKHVTAVKA